jgi:hypothetical protein
MIKIRKKIHHELSTLFLKMEVGFSDGDFLER